MNRLAATLLLSSIASIAALSTPARAAVIWKGDFESGDIKQWSEAEVVAPDRLEIVTNPVSEGQHALRVKVHQGDDPIGASGNRNELVYTDDLPQDEERFYHWKTLWPQEFQSEETWQLFTQWHQLQGGGSPPVEFFTWGDKIFLRVSGTDVWNAPLVKGSWRDFVFHVFWSADKSKAFVELYLDGQLVLPKTKVVTLFKGQSAYLKQGLYRNKTIAHDQVIFHDGMTIGTTLADVAPQLAGQPQSGQALEPGAAENPGQTPTDGASGVEFVQGPDGKIAKSGCDVGGAGVWAPSLLVAALLLVRRRRLQPVRVRARRTR